AWGDDLAAVELVDVGIGGDFAGDAHAAAEADGPGDDRADRVVGGAPLAICARGAGRDDLAAVGTGDDVVGGVRAAVGALVEREGVAAGGEDAGVVGVAEDAVRAGELDRQRGVDDVGAVARVGVAVEAGVQVIEDLDAELVGPDRAADGR